jgi:hypothetical protein
MCARSAPPPALKPATTHSCSRRGWADKQIEGCDFIQLDEGGAISAFTVMVRPMSGVLALAEAMKAHLSDG